MKDILLKGLICDKRVRVYLCRTTDLCETARKAHDLWPTSAAALGRVLSVGTIMGSMLKDRGEKITLQINGDGPLGTIMVDAYSDGRVRGFVGDPHRAEIDDRTGKLAVGKAVGKTGYLQVIRDTGMKDDFTGTVKLVSGEIGEDFAYYFTASEQIPTAVDVGVLVGTDGAVTAAGALIIQMLPDATESDIAYCEKRLAELKPLSELIHESKDINALFKTIFADGEIIAQQPLRFACDCSKAKMAAALAVIKRSDLRKLIDEDHGCEIVCQYCNRKYHFTEPELEAIYGHR